jgi:hypothetical protein
MKPDRSLRGVVVAVAGSLATFCLVATAVYGRMAEAGVNGLQHGAPTVLAGAMAGLFGGGAAAMVVLILLLRRR